MKVTALSAVPLFTAKWCLNLFYIGMTALAINLAVVGLGTGIAYALGWRPK